MSDQEITCAECGSAFMFREAEQQFYAERGLAAPPKRCKPCRQARKAQNGEGDRGAARGGGAPRGAPRFGGGAPRGGPGGGGYGGAPRGGGGFGGGGPRRGPGGYTGGAADSRGGPGRPAGDRGRFGGNNGAREAPRPPREGEAWGTRPSEAGARPPRRQGQGAAPANGESAPRPRARPERPKYDVTCAECGASAQVPFKPLEGRQVFCQPCYKARKGTAGAPEAAPVGDDSDTGIVE